MRKISLTVLGVLLATNTAVAADSFTGIRSLNNSEKQIDYEDTSFVDTSNGLNFDKATKEIFTDNKERDMSNLTVPKDSKSSLLLDKDPLTTALSDKELSWLVEKGYVSRDSKISINNSTVKISDTASLFDRNKPNEPVSKSEFLMHLYKSIYGPISSRTLLINTQSVREAAEAKEVIDKEGKVTYSYGKLTRQIVSVPNKKFSFVPFGSSGNKIGSFTYGDFITFVSPNVIELYLKELLDKNIISVEEISDLAFRNTYKSLGTGEYGVTNLPLWYNKLETYKTNFSSFLAQSSGRYSYDQTTLPLGAGYNISGISNGMENGKATPTVTIERVSKSYFMDESISSIRALRYLESLLRLTEKDMTATEAQIVTYKYGASYLNFLNEEDKKTVMFLTAKGILNFEDRTEYRNLYGNLSKEFYYKILYRVANKDARLNFSEIKLTDSDNFWIGKGYTEVNLEFNEINPSLESELKEKTKNILPVPDIRTSEVKLFSEEEEKTASKKGNRVFSLSLVKSKFATNTLETKDYLVKKVFDSLDKYSYNGIVLSELTKGKEIPDIVKNEKLSASDLVEVSFKVSATSTSMALATVDSRLQSLFRGYFSSQQVNAVTKYNSSDGKETTLVPASLFKSKESTIRILEDKVLLNSETGTTAVLLQEKNMALVGTHVIQNTDLLITAINGERYYNMDIVSKLMSNLYVSQIDKNSFYFTSGISKGSEKLAEIRASTGSLLGKTYVAKFDVTNEGSDVGDPVISSSYFANLSQMGSGTNVLIRDFETLDETNQRVNFKVILEFSYKTPPNEISFSGTAGVSDNPSLKEVNDFFYVRPKDPELADWWDNNIRISNAFSNVFYGTKDVEYIRSGYLIPNVTILYDDNSPAVRTYINRILQEVGSQIGDNWMNKFLGDSKGGNQKLTSPEDSINGESLFYPKKDLGVNMFPKWIHAMFNNSHSGGEVSNRKNGLLWRIMMSTRVFQETPSKKIVGNNYLYSTNNGTYVVTNGGKGTVYRLIDPTNVKMPMIFDEKVDVIRLVTRTESYFENKFNRRYVTFKGDKFFVVGVDGNKINLVDSAVIKGSAFPSARNGVQSFDIVGKITDISGNESSKREAAIKSRFDQLLSVFTGKTSLTVDTTTKINKAKDYDNAMDSFEETKYITGRNDMTESEHRIYFEDHSGLSGASDTDRIFWDNQKRSYLSYQDIAGEEVSARVQISLKMNYWAINDNGELYPRRIPATFQIPNLYYNSLSKGVIDSIIANSIKSVDPLDLEEGSKLYVGDLAFTKFNGKFVSDPVIVNESHRGLIADAQNTESVSNEIAKLLLSFPIRAGNSLPPLSAFVNKSGLTMPINGMELDKTLGGDLNTAFLYTSDGKNNYKKEEYDRNRISAIKTLIFYVMFDKGLQARLVNEERKTYQLLMSTNSLSEGNLKEVPFFSENLSLRAKEDLFLAANRANFKPVGAAANLRTAYTKLYNEAFTNDLVKLLKMTLITALQYLMLMSWICYAVLKFHLGTSLLQIWRDPVVGSERNGFDLIKIISFGVFNLDSTISGSKVFLANLVICIFIYLLLFVV